MTIEIATEAELAACVTVPVDPADARFAWRELRRGFDPDERFLCAGVAASNHVTTHGSQHPVDGVILPDGPVPLLADHCWTWPLGLAWFRRFAHTVDFIAEFAPRLPGSGTCWRGIVDGHSARVSVGLDFMQPAQGMLPLREHLQFAQDEPRVFQRARICELSICTEGAAPHAVIARRWRERRTSPAVLLSAPWET